MKMASKKIFVNVSAPRAAAPKSTAATPKSTIAARRTMDTTPKSKVVAGRTMDTVRRNKDIVAHTNKSQASGAPGSLKLISDWKNAEEIDKTDFSWYLEDNETKVDIHIYLVCGMIDLNEQYDVMGRIRDICMVPNTNTIYVPARKAHKCEKVRYCLSIIKYDTNEVSSKFSEKVSSNIANNIVSMLIFISSMHYCKDDSIFYKLLIIDMFYSV